MNRAHAAYGLVVAVVAVWGVVGTWPDRAAFGDPPGNSDVALDTGSDTNDPSAEDDSASELWSEEAIGRFQQLLERRPMHTSAFAGLVKHYTESGKLAELVAEYEERVAALPDSTAPRIVLARLYMRTGDAEKAAACIDQVGHIGDELARDESRWQALQAEVYQRLGRLDDAQDVLRQALAGAKTILERMRLAEALADMYLRSSERDKAVQALTQLADEYADNYLHRRRIADALAQRDLHDAAIEQYRAILSLADIQPEQRCETLRELGRSYERLSRSQEAIDAYAEATGLLSSDHWLHQELHERIVHLYRASGRLDDLIAYCRDQITRAPEQTAMRMLLAEVLGSMGEVGAARQVFEEAVALFPKDRALGERRIQFLERSGDEQGVASEYERLISQHPEDVELYIGYGQFLAVHKHLDAARNQWKRVLNNEVTDAVLALRLGSLFEPYELYDDAVECYERAIQVAPLNSEAYSSLARLWFYRGDREKSLATLRRLAETKPDDGATHAAVCHAALSMGLNDAALDAISRACELSPENVEYQLSRSNLLVHAGRLDDALAVRREVLGHMVNPVQQAQELNILASMYGTAGKLGDLRAGEESRIDQTPGDKVALMLLARAADFERDFASARSWLMRLLEVDSAHEEARRQLARLYEAVGDVDSAVEEYRRLIELHPNRARQSYQAIADVKLRYNDRAGAIETFEQLVRSSPDNATVLKDVAEQLVRLSEYDKGLTYYEESLRLGPERHEVRLAYGKALVEAGRLEDALDAFKGAALQRTDRDSAFEAMTELHEVASQLGDLEPLIDELQNRLELDPTDTLVARTLAALLIDEFEYNRAMELLDTVLRHQPRDVELHLTRAELLRRLARFDDAIEQYRRIVRMPDVDRDFLLGELGKTYFESGQIDAARKQWRQVSHKLYAGTLLRNNGLVTDAVEVLQEGIRLKPDDYGLHRNLVRALQLAGRVDEALEAAERLLDLEPDNVLNIRELAKAHLERGNRETAAKIASRLFSAGVAEKTMPRPSQTSYGAGSVFAASLQSAWGRGFYGSGSSRNNLDGAVRFFQESGLLAELGEVLLEQIAAQPENAVLRDTAANLFSETLGKPEVSLSLLRELETATFPVEHQDWLGQCSQRDYFRIRQNSLIAQKPALRDARLAELEAKSDDSLSRDEVIELAAIRQAQGLHDKAIELLERAASADSQDVVALSALIDALIRVERFADAEPHVHAITELLESQRQRLQEEMIERVRRDFVRSLPIQLQLRVSEDLLADIAHKWTLGQSFVGAYLGGMQSMGYYRARLTLGTIYAKTDRMEQARVIWDELSPSHPADVDGWTTLAGVAQLHEQQDAAFRYYTKALDAARAIRGDQLLQRIYGNTMSQLWYGREEAIDSSFNKIVDAFATHERLLDLYDFLRETNQLGKARRIAEQYELYDALKAEYRQRVDKARQEFASSTDAPLDRSVAYFTPVCKLAELHDCTGDWAEAERIYSDYVKDFPDELGLLITLGEVAERLGEYDQAIEWEKKVIGAKERLVRRAREWALRSLAVTPMQPQMLQGQDTWSWAQRWGTQQWWWYSSGQRPLDVWPSWVRIAQLYLSIDNVIAASDAMDRAIGAGVRDREKVATQLLGLIRQRQLVSQTLPVLRSLAVHLPTNEDVQIAFAESLEANDKPAVALEVYRRLLRRGVSDVGKLAQVRQRLDVLAPDAEDTALATLESLAAEVESDPANANKRLRLAKAYYYSLRVDDALETLGELVKMAPHLEGVHDLLVECHTLKGDSDRLVEALRTKIDRVQNEQERSKARERLVEELLTRGDNDEALEVLKLLADPKNPQSFEHVALLLHYFGRHDEAVEQFETASRSQSRGMWQGDRGGQMIVRSMVIKGDVEGAADKMLETIDQQIRQAVQYGGMMSMYWMFDMQQEYFEPFKSLFLLEPRLQDRVGEKLLARHEANTADPQAAKVLMQFYRSTGRVEQAESMLESLAKEGTTDQMLVMALIDRAIQKREFARAIELAEKFVKEQPKPQLPPGIPAQFAGMLNLMSPRNTMLCRLGDLYWQTDRPEDAFAAYRQIIDEQVDETHVAYATICLLRDRVEDARAIVEPMLDKQQVKSASLLQFRAILAAIEDDPEKMFDALADSLEASAGGSNPFMYDQSGAGTQLLASAATAADQLDRFKEYVLAKRIARNPNSWDDYLVLVRTLHAAGRVEDAFAILDQAAEQKALRVQAMKERINLLEGYAAEDVLIPLYEQWLAEAEKKVDPPSALQRLWRGTSQQTGPTHTDSERARLGALLWDTGKHDEAVEVWSERLDKTASASHVRLGNFFLEREDYARARSSFERAVELKPDDTSALKALASLVFHEGDALAALKHLAEVFVVNYRPSPPQQEQVDPFDPYAQMMAMQNRQNPQQEQGVSLRSLAFDISRDAALADGVAVDDADQRLALHTLTGDWAPTESELLERLATAPYDPMTWTLWALVQERKGDWAEAVRARQRVRILSQTTIPKHREQLKLVLAGKQIQDAAAGTKDTDEEAAAAQAASSGSRYYSYYGDYYGMAADTDTQHLAALHIKLGDYERAERLYLLNRRSGPASILSSIAGMMHDQGAKERAQELARLSLIVSQGSNQVPTYATMLAAAGQVDEAGDLLCRAYRMMQPNRSTYSAMMYGGYYDDSQTQLENVQEQNYSHALWELLRKAGRLDEALARWRAEIEQRPNDLQLRKVVLSLQMRDKRWEDARASLGEWHKVQENDLPLLTQELQICLQTGEWQAAVTVLGRLRELAPGQQNRWRVVESFIRLMQGDRSGAVAAIEPLLETDAFESNVQPGQIWVVLAAAGEHERLRGYLESLAGKDRLDVHGAWLLYRVQVSTRSDEAALQTALKWFWRQVDWRDGAMDWLEAVATADSRGVSADTLRAEDKALMTLVREGPPAGMDAFARAVADDPESIDARRGLVLAAHLAGEPHQAAEANGELLERLSSRRSQVWYSPRRPRVRELVGEFLDRAKAGGLDTTMVLGLSISMSGTMQHQFQQAQQQAAAVTYGSMWAAHERWQVELLNRARESDRLRDLLTRHARISKSPVNQSQDNDMYYTTVSFGGTVTYRTGYPMNRSQPHVGFARDWRKALREQLYSQRRFEELLEEYEAMGSRTPESEWVRVAETHAVLGGMDEARRWLRRFAEHSLAELRASDVPELVDQSNQYSYWRIRAPSSEDTAQLSRSLHVTLPRDKDSSDVDARRRSPVSLAAIATMDEEVERKLVALADAVGPGWGKSQTVSQLLTYYWLKDQPRDTIALLERVMEFDELLLSDRLRSYIRSCFQVKDVQRIERVLEAIGQHSASLNDQVRLTRLMLLRHLGQDAEADDLERELIQTCRTDAPNPCMVDSRLVAMTDVDQMLFQRMSSLLSRRSSFVSRFRPTSRTNVLDVPTAALLADALAIPYDAAVGPHDLTLTKIRESYERHGFDAHAARLIERELAEAVNAYPSHQARLLMQRATLLERSGDTASAASAARQVEAIWLAEATAAPRDPGPHRELANLYASDAYGKDLDKARQAMQAASRLDPTLGSESLWLAGLLFDSGQHEEAWSICKKLMSRGEVLSGNDILYQAGLASWRSGDRDSALPLLRQAMWRHPDHELAAEAREIVHD